VVDYLPLITASVSFALTGLLAAQYGRRRRRHQLVWTTSLALLGLAAVFAFLGNPDVLGWTDPLYRSYLALTALPVGLIGLGVLLLFADRPHLGRYYGYYWLGSAILVGGVCAFAPIVDPVDGVPLASEGPNVGGRYLPPFGTVSLLQTLPGAAAFVGGGVYTWWRDPSRRYGWWLAAGGILFTVAGLSSRLGVRSYFFVITALAALVTFIGFIIAVEHTAHRAPVPAKA